MKDGRLNEYITTFQDLVTRTGLDQNSPNMLQTFAQGLQGTLATTCIMQDSPENFLQWVQSCYVLAVGSKLLCPCRDTRLDVSTRYLWVQGDQWFNGLVVQRRSQRPSIDRR